MYFLPLLFAIAGPPATSDRVAAQPVTVASAIHVDGDLSEEVWRQAPIITGFRQREPNDGAQASFETEARVAYDSNAIYVAVQAIDPEPSRIVGIRTRRDGQSPSDWIRVLIDSFHDRRSAYEFAVNPAGVKSDTYWFNDGNNDPGWDAVWDVAVSRNDRGWRAEFRIPFSQLRFRPSADATFGLAVVRQIGRLNETTTWPLLSKSANGYVSSFGELTGLRLGQSQKRLELVPYVVGDLRTQPVELGNPLQHSTDGSGEVGVDLKYALQAGLTLTATVNPDFGQVEADPAVVNLSAFETFFSERRPFFVEGSGIFQFDTDCNDGSCSGLFYSRRIGRAPRGSPEVPDGGYSSVPGQSTILGAAKLTGRVGGFSIGALNALTADEYADIADGPLRSRQMVEPMTSYSVVRARREFGNQSGLGFMMTSTNRSLDEFTRFLPGQAYTGGVDWDWRLSRKYSVTGYVAGSNVRGDAAAISDLQQNNVHSYQRPDSGYLEYDPARTSLSGATASLGFSKIAGEHVRFNTNVSMKTPGFDSNDVGFLRRADTRSMGNWLQWRNEKPSKYLRSFRFNLNQWATWNFDGDRLNLGYNVNAHATFTSNWSTGSGFNLIPQPFDDRATRGGPGAYASAEKSVWGYLNTDSRKPLQGSVFFFTAAAREGSRSWNVNPSILWRPSSFLSVDTGISVNGTTENQQWIENTDTRYVFGTLQQRTVSMTARVNYTVTPNLSIQLYAQPFVSAGDYSGFKHLVDGRARDVRDRFAFFDYLENPDFNYRSFRTTNVLRWEYRPGSTLFVVWQQGRENTLDYGTFRFGRDMGGVFDAPAYNVFLVKWAYWLNY
jgi:Domain of unknown function (DUF5916)/Carbohydrate family 9 binding domain-like